MKTAVISGGNSGIGKATATALAKKGYRVIIHGKDPSKTKQLAEEIKSASGNSNVEFIAADVASVKGMKQLADEILQKTDVVHALVLSTGVILSKYIQTEDGLEAGFAIQYLSRFAVTQMLMPALLKGHAKIVMVVAPDIKGAKIHFEDITLKNNFTMLRAMAQEMYANHLFVQEFAKRHPAADVKINSANVGVANTGIARHSNPFLRLMLKLVGTRPEKAASNFVYLASSEEVNFSGYFLKKPGKPAVREKTEYDNAEAEKLWEISMDLIRPAMKTSNLTPTSF